MSEVINIKELNERIERESVFVDTLRSEMGKVIIGQNHLVDTLLIGLLFVGFVTSINALAIRHKVVGLWLHE